MKNYEIKYVACSVDENYKEQLIIFISSLVFNNLSCNFHLLILHEKLSEEFKIELEYFLTYQKSIKYNLVEINDSILEKTLVYGHVSRATYYRILLPVILDNNIETILYLDLDIIVNGDIQKFWDIDIKNYSHLGIVNVGIDNQFKNNLGISISSTYFNAGVLMINLNWWRENEVYKKSFAFMTQFPEKIILWDQDVLNVVLEGKWKELPFEYNAQESIFRKDLATYQQKEFKEAYFNPKIIHFTGGGHSKPWHKECRHELKNEYAFYHYKSKILRSPIWIRFLDFDIRLTKLTLPLIYINRFLHQLERIKFRN